MTETRTLAAILAADVVGYSRLMGEDEAGAARAVRERRDAAAPIVRGFGGRLVKTTGDGVLLEFPSVVAAVECAVLMQKMMAERNAALPEAKRLVYRMGANLGDVLIEGDDILGDGVNVAARLEESASPAASASQARLTSMFKAALQRTSPTLASRGSRTSPNPFAPMRCRRRRSRRRRSSRGKRPRQSQQSRRRRERVRHCRSLPRWRRC